MASEKTITALYSVEHADKIAKAARKLGFSAKRNERKVTIDGFSGSLPEELKAWQELRKVAESDSISYL
jgi:predicted DNA-binding ribbon-helix-helix protein